MVKRASPPPRIFSLLPFALASLLDLEGERLGDPMQGEVARNFVGVATAFDFRTLKGHYRKLFAIEEIGTLQLLVALGDAGVHAFDRDGQIH